MLIYNSFEKKDCIFLSTSGIKPQFISKTSAIQHKEHYSNGTQMGSSA